MIRTAARWYLVVLGVAMAVGALRTLPSVLPDTTFAAVQETVAAIAGVLLVLGGVAGLMRLPGRIPAAYLGMGAGLAALGQNAGALVGAEGAEPFVAGIYVAMLLLVIASWSLWPSNG